MARLTDKEISKFRKLVSHRNDCLTPSCDQCAQDDGDGKVWELMALALEDLFVAGVSIKDLTAKIEKGERDLDVAAEALAEAEEDARALDEQLNSSWAESVDTRALCNWAYDAGAELPDLRCSAGTYEQARLRLLARGGPACSSYEAKGTGAGCKCGRPYREHRRELQGA